MHVLISKIHHSYLQSSQSVLKVNLKIQHSYLQILQFGLSIQFNEQVYFPFPQPLLKIRFISKNQLSYSPSIFTVCRKVPFSIIVHFEHSTRLIPNRSVYPYLEAVPSQRGPVKTLTWWRYIPAALPSLLTQH